MIKVSGREITITNFPNGESLIPTEYLNNLDKDNFVDIEFKYLNDKDILHLYFLLGHLCDHKINKRNITIYYMPYSRMDRDQNGNCFTLRHVTTLLNNVITMHDKINIVEPHSEVSMNYFNAKRINVITPLMQNILKLHPNINMICYPDKGAKDRFNDDSAPLKVVYCNKVRDFNTGEIKGLELAGETSVSGKDILILDDLCSKGGTFYHTAKKLKENGAGKIYLGVCHMEYTARQGCILQPNYNFEAEDKFTSIIEHIYCTNSMLNWVAEEGLRNNFRNITIYDLPHFLRTNTFEEIEELI